MLVLSRKVGESIFINESIRVIVVHAANGRIRLGIDAPPEVKVLREELIRSSSNSSPSKFFGSGTGATGPEVAS